MASKTRTVALLAVAAVCGSTLTWSTPPGGGAARDVDAASTGRPSANRSAPDVFARSAAGSAAVLERGPAGPPAGADRGKASDGSGAAGSAAGDPDLDGDRVAASDQGTSPEQFGARGDGIQDDTAALQAALDDVAEGGTVILRRDATYLHSDVLRLTTPDVTIVGDGATLTATAELRSAFHVDADSVTVSGLTLTLASSTVRFRAREQMKVRISGDGVVLRDVHIRGAAAAGIYVGDGSSDFLLDRVSVVGSRADGIHITGGAHDGRVISPVTSDTGDDGVAVVSYKADGFPCERIRISSPTVDGTTWGRGVSVIGGNDIVYTDISVRNTDAAGVYIASEGDPFFTFPSIGVLVHGGTVSGANTNPAVDHGAVVVYAGHAGTDSTDITVRGVAVNDTRAGATWDVGVLADPGAAVGQVTLTGLTIRQGARSAFYTNVAPAVRLVDVSKDGEPVVEHRGW